jgi:hypothetical protein
MSTLSELRTLIKQRISQVGPTYDDYIDASVNWAIEEICTVNWRFLLTSIDIITLPTQTIYDLWDNTSSPTKNNFGKVYKVYIDNGTTKTELMQGTREDIDLNAPSSTGQPRLYSIDGVTYDNISATRVAPQINIGYPAPSGNGGLNYTVTVAYYRKLPDLSADTDRSAISEVYRDDPIIEGAIHRMWKNLEVEDKAADSLNKFLLCMRSMAAVMPYDGKMYDQIIIGASSK